MSEIKMDYDLMDDMQRTFLQGMEQLQDTNQAMQMLANEMEDGALVGRGGEAFTNAIRGNLCPAIARLTEKFNELATDIQAAKQAMMEADRESEGLY